MSACRMCTALLRVNGEFRYRNCSGLVRFVLAAPQHDTISIWAAISVQTRAPAVPRAFGVTALEVLTVLAWTTVTVQMSARRMCAALLRVNGEFRYRNCSGLVRFVLAAPQHDTISIWAAISVQTRAPAVPH